jgi:nitrate reductase gamma subunit
MFKDRPAGWMHALIFWGFLVLLFRASWFFQRGFFTESHEDNIFFITYLLMKDCFVLAISLAVIYALIRRLILKPKRLTLSFEGISILLLILLIMFSDILFDGVEIAVSRSGWIFYKPLGSVMAALALDNRFSDYYSLWPWAYWTHILSILVFLVILPRSKHFHIITSIPNVFLGNVTQTGNQLHRIDFEDESKETFGVTRIEEFSWKKLLDLHTCTECGRCDVFCPALNSRSSQRPNSRTS